MIGLSVLLLIIVYIWLARFVVKKLTTKRAKYIAIAIFVLVPTWDIAPGYLYFKYLCATEGEIKIYKTVSGVEGFFRRNMMPNKEDIAVYGYGYSEGQTLKGEYIRYTVNHNSGKLIEMHINNPISKYQFVMGEYVQTYSITRSQDRIEDVQTGEIIATKTDYWFDLGWVRLLLMKLGPSEHVAQCPYPPPTYKAFFNTALKPVYSSN